MHPASPASGSDPGSDPPANSPANPPAESLAESPAPADGAVRLSDGRTIAYRTYGAAAGRTVLMLHGTPGSRLKFAAAHEAAGRLGWRLIAPDRWGYGGTSPHRAPSLAAFAHDMAALADALAIGRFAVMGVSGGGPYAAAVAAYTPSRVQALALVAPVGPIAGEAPAGMAPMHRFCFGPLARAPRTTGAVFRLLRGLLAVSPRLGLAVAMANVPMADRRVLAAPGVAQRLAVTFQEGLAPGAQGPVTDLTLFGRDWQVPLQEARMPARLWLGTQDRNVPLVAARRLAARLGACDVHDLSGHGHLWVALNYAEVLSWIDGAVPDRK